MRRIRFTMAGVVCAVVCTQALAGEPSSTRPDLIRPHAAKTKIVKHAASKSASLSDVNFSDPYGPPVGVGKVKGRQFPAPQREEPVNPEGGFSFTAGRDAPDAPFTGGIKLRF
jgi:hypothetical protein